MTEEEKYKIAKGQYDGPFSAKWNKIFYIGEVFRVLGDVDSVTLTTGEVAMLMNQAYQAGVQAEMKLQQEELSRETYAGGNFPDDPE